MLRKANEIILNVYLKNKPKNTNDKYNDDMKTSWDNVHVLLTIIFFFQLRQLIFHPHFAP